MAARARAREMRDLRDVNKFDFYLFSSVPLTYLFQHPAKESIKVSTSELTRERNVSAPLLALPVSS
jgi:hypothetical protein